MAIIKCKMCGGELNFTESATVAECEYCGSMQTIPNQDNEKKLTLFARADRLRRACEFDKAAGVYESIVADFPEEAEAYWGLVLCRYGIEYVDDPATGKKVPTCHRSSFDSILEDEDFDQACENADAIARRLYREEAKAIEDIRRGILEVSGKEAPYDIFICYKETDENGDRTVDSVIAQDVYDALTEKGYRVFFSRISLEDKLGTEYEPYIFAALNSAKVMLVFGTDYEHFNAVWVKNEWSRFLSLIAAGQKKTLIPCFKGVDAYDMPKEFQRLQAQDMGKVGAIQDLLRGIEKIVKPSNAKMAAGVASLVDRGSMALEEQNWEEAKGLFEKALEQNARSAEAYFGLVLAELEASDWNGFRQKYQESPLSLNDNKNLHRARKFARGELLEFFDQLDASMGMGEAQIVEAWKQEEDALIARAEELVGENGAILALESKTVDTRINVLPGIWLDAGLTSPYFATDTETMAAVFDDACVLLTDWKINNIQDILPLLEQIVNGGKSLVIFAWKVDGDALATLIVNKLRGTLNVATVDLGDCGGHLIDVLQDIAAVTGGQVISKELGYDIKKTDLSMLGRCRRIWTKSYSDRTGSALSVIAGAPDRDQVVRDRVKELRDQLERAENDDERACLTRRIERLESGVAMIRLAGSSEAEVKARLRHTNTALELRLNRLNGTVPLTDEELAEKERAIQENLVDEAIYKAGGPDGFIAVEESKTAFSSVIVCEGMRLDLGYLSPYLVSDTKKMESDMDDPCLFITDQEITAKTQILPCLDKIVQSGKKLVLFAEDFSDEVLGMLITNHQRDTLNVQCVSVADLGPRRREILEDIAILTGGTLISSALEKMSGDEQFACLGRARRVVVTKTSTSIIDGAGDGQQIRDRVHHIREEILNALDERPREELQERLARLASGVAIIRVGIGAGADAEIKERKGRIKALLAERLKQLSISEEYRAEWYRKQELRRAEELEREKAAEEAERRRAQAAEEARRKAEAEMEMQRQEEERRQEAERLRLEKEQRHQEEERRRLEEEGRRRREEKLRAERRAALEREKSALQTELSELKGLFTGKRRKELETRLVQIEAELKRF